MSTGGGCNNNEGKSLRISHNIQKWRGVFVILINICTQLAFTSIIYCSASMVYFLIWSENIKYCTALHWIVVITQLQHTSWSVRNAEEAAPISGPVAVVFTNYTNTIIFVFKCRCIVAREHRPFRTVAKRGIQLKFKMIWLLMYRFFKLSHIGNTD